MPTAGPTDRLHGTVPGGWEQWQDNGVLAVREPAEDRQSRHLAVGHGFTCYSGPPCPATRPWPQEALVNPVDGVGTARLPWFPLAWKHTAAWRHAPAKRTCKQWPCRRGPPAAPVGHMHAASDSSRDRPPDRPIDRRPPARPFRLAPGTCSPRFRNLRGTLFPERLGLQKRPKGVWPACDSRVRGESFRIGPRVSGFGRPPPSEVRGCSGKPRAHPLDVFGRPTKTAPDCGRQRAVRHDRTQREFEGHTSQTSYINPLKA